MRLVTRVQTIRPLDRCLRYETILRLKQVLFHPKAIEEIRSFPASVKQELGKLIHDLQTGEILSMPVSRPMPGVASGVSELRIRDATGAYRAFYIAKTKAGIVVFHAFVKKTQQTPEREIKLGQKRLKEMTE